MASVSIHGYRDEAWDPMKDDKIGDEALDNNVTKIDKASKVRACPPPPENAYPGIRVKRPKTIFNKAGLSSSVPSSSSLAPDMSTVAESMLPPRLLNLFELSSLEGSGQQVQWPDGLDTASAHAIIFDFFSPMIRKEDGGTHEGVELDGEILDPPTTLIPEQHISSSEVDPIIDQQMNIDYNLDNLSELLSLSECGESVSWPVGLSADSVRLMLQRRS